MGPENTSETEQLLRTGIRLLLVDPDPKERARLRNGLEPRFRVAEASTAVEALARLDEQWFNAILTDYELADHSGVWLLEQVARKRPSVHRTLMSAKWVPNAGGLKEAGVLWLFMAKPVAPEDFSLYFRPRGG